MTALDMVLEAIHRVAPEVDGAAIDPDDDLRDALDLDSIDFLTLVTHVEQRSGIEIPDRDYCCLLTLDAFAGYVAERIEQAA